MNKDKREGCETTQEGLRTAVSTRANSGRPRREAKIRRNGVASPSKRRNKYPLELNGENAQRTCESGALDGESDWVGRARRVGSVSVSPSKSCAQQSWCPRGKHPVNGKGDREKVGHSC